MTPVGLFPLTRYTLRLEGTAAICVGCIVLAHETGLPVYFLRSEISLRRYRLDMAQCLPDASRRPVIFWIEMVY